MCDDGARAHFAVTSVLLLLLLLLLLPLLLPPGRCEARPA
jgi:hypothetical protein